MTSVTRMHTHKLNIIISCVTHRLMTMIHARFDAGKRMTARHQTLSTNRQ